MRIYTRQNVLEAAIERIAWLFDLYETIVVSVSGGKDSTALFELVWREAQRRGRVVHAFFLDQEAEYAGTIEIIRGIMSRPGVVPHWYQVPIHMTSAVSFEQDMLYAWGPGEDWMRARDPLAIHEIEGAYPQRFYPFIEWFERRFDARTCFLVGQRAEESQNRLRAVIKSPGAHGILWSTATAGAVVKFYPLYDWSFDDIFLYFHRFGVAYNRIYDFMHAKDPGAQLRSYRVSNLIHEQAKESLETLQEFEPDTYERLLRRLKGAQTAARYVGEGSIYAARKRPPSFESWRVYRDHLLSTLTPEQRGVFDARFARQKQDERVAKAQCKQILINDRENNVPIPRARAEAEGAAAVQAAPAADWKQVWWDRL